MIRWPIQLIAFIVFLLAVYTGVKVYKKNSLMKVWLPFYLGWVVHSFIFLTIVVFRVCVYRGESPLSEIIILWANVLTLHGGLAALFTFTSLLGFNIRTHIDAVISMVRKGKGSVE